MPPLWKDVQELQRLQVTYYEFERRRFQVGAVESEAPVDDDYNVVDDAVVPPAAPDWGGDDDYNVSHDDDYNASVPAASAAATPLEATDEAATTPEYVEDPLQPGTFKRKTVPKPKAHPNPAQKQQIIDAATHSTASEKEAKAKAMGSRSSRPSPPTDSPPPPFRDEAFSRTTNQQTKEVRPPRPPIVRPANRPGWNPQRNNEEDGEPPQNDADTADTEPNRKRTRAKKSPSPLKKHARQRRRDNDSRSPRSGGSGRSVGTKKSQGTGKGVKIEQGQDRGQGATQSTPAATKHGTRNNKDGAAKGKENACDDDGSFSNVKGIVNASVKVELEKQLEPAMKAQVQAANNDRIGWLGRH